jgi:hypothetical protein
MKSVVEFEPQEYEGLLLILLTSNASTGERDLHTWKCPATRCGSPVGLPRTGDFSPHESNRQ